MEDEDRTREAVRLIAAQSWFALATVDQNGTPSVSYAPFAPVDGALGLVVSRLASHTVNLLARRPASVLVVDEDAREADAYARARFSIDVTASPHAAGSAQAEAVWSALEARHGATVRILRTLPDFDAISLEPQSGRLVLGFASAHDLSAGAIVAIVRAVGR
ncbi:MAG: pyridoxamine 5'-phosphate oxidase family protein [Candidatus Elarobacter sp.]